MRYCYSLLLCLCLFAWSERALAQVAVCYSNVNVALPIDGCTVDIQPEWLDGGSYVPSGTMIGLSLEGNEDLGPGTYTLLMTVSAYNNNQDLVGEATCWSTVLVEDKTAPEITCQDQTILLVHPAQAHTINVSGLVSATDNCSIAYRTYTTVDPPPAYGSTDYEASALDFNGNTATCTGTITLADGEPQTYCAAVRNDNYEHISNVNLALWNTIDESSGNDGGYRHHLPTGNNTMFHGFNYTMSYAPGFTYGAYREYWSVYLDKNRDGDFTDAGELLHRWNGYGGNSFDFSSPGTATGWSRMRVVMSYGGYGNSCGGGWGEVEDISVYLQRFTIIWPGFRTPTELEPALAAAESVPATNVAFDSGQPQDAAVARELRRREAEMPRSAGFSVPQLATNITVYPNPATAGDQVVVRGLSSASGDLQLHDLGGRILASYPVNGSQTSLILPADLPAGVYLLGLVGERWRKRVVVR